MTKDLSEIRKNIREQLRLDFIIPDDIPDIELYMDQVTRFMDNHLQNNLRSKEDKTLTKTMINNYTKNKLVPPPNKKKYSREHLILLIYIYYLKNVISMNDIRKLLGPMVDGEFSEDELFDIYNDIFEMEKAQYFQTEHSVAISAKITDKKFPENKSSKDEYLNKMAFIYLLGYDIFSKKRLIEKLIDELPDSYDDEDK